ncbi:unnamed protein product [Merluccius merluccius]
MKDRVSFAMEGHQNIWRRNLRVYPRFTGELGSMAPMEDLGAHRVRNIQSVGGPSHGIRLLLLGLTDNLLQCLRRQLQSGGRLGGWARDRWFGLAASNRRESIQVYHS